MIELKNIHKSYPYRVGGHRKILDGLDLKLNLGESIGIMGRNGAGKSTLTRIIGGIEHYEQGSIRRTMSVSWPLGYAAAFQGRLTGADNTRFIARIYGRPVDEVLGIVEDFADLGQYFRMPVHTYSAGMRSRLSFGLSLAIDFDCILIDEITGAGDHRFATKSQAAIDERRQRGSLIMVSHDWRTLERYCGRFAILNGGRLQTYDTAVEMMEAYNAL